MSTRASHRFVGQRIQPGGVGEALTSFKERGRRKGPCSVQTIRVCMIVAVLAASAVHGEKHTQQRSSPSSSKSDLSRSHVDTSRRADETANTSATGQLHDAT